MYFILRAWKCWCHPSHGWQRSTTVRMLLPHTEDGASCGISHLLCFQSGKIWHLPAAFERDRLLVCTDDGGKITVGKDLDCVKLELRQASWTSILPVTETQPGFFFLCLGAAFACVADQRSGWLLSLLLLLPVSHYDVPQQGLLGELILIQQQIQRHEEEVRRAAAASNARPPPPEPAPSPPQQKRKVKVPIHLDLPC